MVIIIQRNNVKNSNKFSEDLPLLFKTQKKQNSKVTVLLQILPFQDCSLFRKTKPIQLKQLKRDTMSITVISQIAVQFQNENCFIVLLLIVKARLPLCKTIQTFRDCTVQQMNILIFPLLCLMPEVAAYYLLVLGIHVEGDFSRYTLRG